MVDYAKVVDVEMIKYFRSRKISHREGPALAHCNGVYGEGCALIAHT